MNNPLDVSPSKGKQTYNEEEQRGALRYSIGVEARGEEETRSTGMSGMSTFICTLTFSSPRFTI